MWGHKHSDRLTVFVKQVIKTQVTDESSFNFQLFFSRHATRRFLPKMYINITRDSCSSASYRGNGPLHVRLNVQISDDQTGSYCRLDSMSGLKRQITVCLLVLNLTWSKNFCRSIKTDGLHLLLLKHLSHLGQNDTYTREKINIHKIFFEGCKNKTLHGVIFTMIVHT